jgi:predicted PurR-regulated permease PerM
VNTSPSNPDPSKPPEATPSAAGPEPHAAASNNGTDTQVLPGVQRFVFSGAALGLGILALHHGKTLLMPLAFAALLAFVLDPVVTWLRRHSVPRGVAVGAVLALALSLLVGVGALMANQVSELGKELPTYRKNIQQKLHDLRPAAVPSGTVREFGRIFGVVMGEFDAATKNLNMGKKESPGATRVTVETDDSSPLEVAVNVLTTVGVQLATAGLVIILVVFMLLQRIELRDRLLRVMGGDQHQMADALSESAEKVSRYLLAQVLVNVGYGIPMALGLWWIGVPGAWLWGGLAALLRFIPFLGPAIGAIFPLVLAFAVDPGWSVVLWTLALILVLEVISNNVVEPLAYSGNTGVSPLAVLISAAFWATLWGPLGLVLATPLTVCLVVVGRHLAPLRFLEVLLGSEPVFDSPNKLYHRLISGDLDEAEDMAYQEVRQTSLARFYGDTALPMLGVAARLSDEGVTAAHRHRLLDGTARFVNELQADDTAAQASNALAPKLLCVGLRTELDTLSADMLAHALAHAGLRARALPVAALQQGQAGLRDAASVQVVYLCSLSKAPDTQVRLVCRRLRRHWPDVVVRLVAWRGVEALASSERQQALGVTAVLFQLPEVLALAEHERAEEPPPSDSDGPGHPGAATEPTPVEALEETIHRSVQRAAAVFRVPAASLMMRTGATSMRCLLAGDVPQPGWSTESAPPEVPPLAGEVDQGLTGVHLDPALVSPHHTALERHPSVASRPVLDTHGAVLGVLALHASPGHTLGAGEAELLSQMARELAPDVQALLTARSPTAHVEQEPAHASIASGLGLTAGLQGSAA